MRRILVENARRKRRLRHGGGRRRGPRPRPVASAGEEADARPARARRGPRSALAEEPAAAAIVKLRYFGGLTTGRPPPVMGVSIRTANRHWAYARAWLYHELNPHVEKPRPSWHSSISHVALL